MTRVLVVDDEPQILRALRINLHARQYDVVTAGSGRGALEAATDAHPDLVILDLGLPDMDGVDVIRSLRRWTQVPIVILSGRMNSAAKVDALDAGADDYVTKPFSVEELLARIRAVTRRTTEPELVEPVQLGRWTVDLNDHVIYEPRAPARTGSSHADRVAAPPGIGQASRAAGESAAAASGGLGTDVRGADPLSTSVRQGPPTQARRRSDSAAPPHHRARNGLPLPAVVIRSNMAASSRALPPQGPASPQPGEPASRQPVAAPPVAERHGWQQQRQSSRAPPIRTRHRDADDVIGRQPNCIDVHDSSGAGDAAVAVKHRRGQVLVQH